MFSAIAHVIKFLLEMVSRYIKMLKFLVIVIIIFNHPRLQSHCLLLTFHNMKGDTNHFSSLIITLGGHPCHDR